MHTNLFRSRAENNESYRFVNPSIDPINFSSRYYNLLKEKYEQNMLENLEYDKDFSKQIIDIVIDTVNLEFLFETAELDQRFISAVKIELRTRLHSLIDLALVSAATLKNAPGDTFPEKQAYISKSRKESLESNTATISSFQKTFVEAISRLMEDWGVKKIENNDDWANTFRNKIAYLFSMADMVAKGDDKVTKRGMSEDWEKREDSNIKPEFLNEQDKILYKPIGKVAALRQFIADINALHGNNAIFNIISNGVYLQVQRKLQIDPLTGR